jgi:hypothetical protein
MTLKQRILFSITFILGVASAAVVELLTSGPWSHVVWAPTAVMLFTKIDGVIDAKKMITAIPHRVRILVGVGLALSVEILAKGSWSHAVWAPTAIMLFTNLDKIFKTPLAPKLDVATASPPPLPDSSEAITPLDKPR